MKQFIITVLLFSFINGYTQDVPLKTNTIIVKGVDFDHALSGFLDFGFQIDVEHTSKSLGIIQTQKYLGKQIKHEVVCWGRIKDSCLIITGCIPGVIHIFHYTNDKPKWTNTWDNSFPGMNNFAKSFNLPLEYIHNKNWD